MRGNSTVAARDGDVPRSSDRVNTRNALPDMTFETVPIKVRRRGSANSRGRGWRLFGAP